LKESERVLRRVKSELQTSDRVTAKQAEMPRPQTESPANRRQRKDRTQRRMQQDKARQGKTSGETENAQEVKVCVRAVM
jgi:hypothetical protein